MAGALGRGEIGGRSGRDLVCWMETDVREGDDVSIRSARWMQKRWETDLGESLEEFQDCIKVREDLTQLSGNAFVPQDGGEGGGRFKLRGYE